MRSFGKKIFITSIIFVLLFTALCGCGPKGRKDEQASDLLKKAEQAAAKKKELPKRKEQTEENVTADEDTIAESGLFEKMSAWTFHFASGAGGWETVLNVEPE